MSNIISVKLQSGRSELLRLEFTDLLKPSPQESIDRLRILDCIPFSKEATDDERSRTIRTTLRLLRYRWMTREDFDAGPALLMNAEVCIEALVAVSILRSTDIRQAIHRCAVGPRGKPLV